jgi:hypothetical protein
LKEGGRPFRTLDIGNPSIEEIVFIARAIKAPKDAIPEPAGISSRAGGNW